MKRYFFLATPTILYQLLLISYQLFAVGCVFTLIFIFTPSKIESVKKGSIKAALAVFVGVCSFITLVLVAKVQGAENYKRGAELGAFLVDYERKHGYYPTELSDLSKELNQSIPKMHIGLLTRSFEYSRPSPKEFKFTMGGGFLDAGCEWVDGGAWDCPG